MKIRIYSPFVPVPVTEGAFRVIFEQAYSLLTLGHEAELVTWKNTPGEFAERSRFWKTLERCPKLTYLGPQQDFRMRRVFTSYFKEEASPEAFYYPKAMLSQLRNLAPCDLAIYHYSFAHVWLKAARHLPPETRRVVHFHNLESDLSALQAENSGPLLRGVHAKNSRKLKSHESQLLNLCNELWFLSPVDLKGYQDCRIDSPRVPERIFLSSRNELAQLRLIPPTFSSQILRWPGNTESPVDKQVVLGFIGGFDFQPNIDSVAWILDFLVPALEKGHFKGKIQFMGRGAQAFMHRRKHSNILEVLPDGFDTDQFFSGISWMLVPHVTGSGVRIKLLDALARKIPVMATPSAVERLHPEIQKHPLIFSSEDPGHWADRAIQDASESTRWKHADLPFPPALNGEEIYRNV